MIEVFAAGRPGMAFIAMVPQWKANDYEEDVVYTWNERKPEPWVSRGGIPYQ